MPVEILVEADLVAHLGFAQVDPGFGDVGSYLAQEVVFDVFLEGTDSVSRSSVLVS